MENQLVNYIEQIVGPNGNAYRALQRLNGQQLSELIGYMRTGATTINHMLWRALHDYMNDRSDEEHENWVNDQLLDAADELALERHLSNSMQERKQTEAPVEAQSFSSGESGGIVRKGNQETPIVAQRPHYGIPETQTVILPFTTYASVVCAGANTATMQQLQVRLTSPYDCLMTSLTAPTGATSYSAGVYNSMLPTGTVTAWASGLYTFPATNTAGGPTAESPMWRDYWDKMYDFYTCLGCEYEITFYNPNTRAGNTDFVIAYGFDTYGSSSSGNVFPTGRTPNQMENWPGLSWKICHSKSDGSYEGTYTTIKGYYRPGQAKRNVNNDEDVKTWTAVDSTPSLTEALTMFIGRAAFNDMTNALGLNVRIKMRYIVQFKDCKEQYRFPYSGQGVLNQSAPTDILTIV